MIKRINKACRYFPCHRPLEDCTFCYCPFYPCGDEGLGKEIYSQRLKKHVWSCADCGWIHRKKTTERIFNLIRKNKEDLRLDTPLSRINRQKIGITHNDTGVIILGHGSRLKKANELIPALIKTVKAATGLRHVIGAFLQLAPPDLAQGIAVLARRRCKKIIIVPFFLFVGNHVSRDIPQIIVQEKKKYPWIRFVFTRNLGEDKRIAEIVEDKIREGMHEPHQ